MVTTRRRKSPPSDQFPNLESQPKPETGHLESRHHEVPDRSLKGYPTYTYKVGQAIKPEHRNVVGIVDIDRGKVTIAYVAFDGGESVAVE